jgi:hypothetical protein
LVCENFEGDLREPIEPRGDLIHRLCFFFPLGEFLVKIEVATKPIYTFALSSRPPLMSTLEGKFVTSSLITAGSRESVLFSERDS